MHCHQVSTIILVVIMIMVMVTVTLNYNYDNVQGTWKSSSSSIRGRLQCCQSVYTWQRLTRGPPPSPPRPVPRPPPRRPPPPQNQTNHHQELFPIYFPRHFLTTDIEVRFSSRRSTQRMTRLSHGSSGLIKKGAAIKIHPSDAMQMN